MAAVARKSVNTSTTYTLAHTAQCKLKLAANRPDRNLRFVLGHAFTLDNLMLRIVEIENKSAKSMFDEGAVSAHGIHEHYDCTAAKAEPKPSEPVHNDGRGRRISFQDNKARPSSIGTGTVGVSSNNNSSQDNGTSSPARKRSPPPISNPKHNYLDEDDESDTSSDDYEEPDTYNYGSKPSATMKTPIKKPARDTYPEEEEEEEEVDDDDEALDDEMSSLSLTRFESASAQPPRMIRSTSSSSSSEEEEEQDGPVTPPQLPADLDLHELISGEKDGDLEDLYESVRRCHCHGQKDDVDRGPKASAVWDVPVEKTEGRRLAVVAVAA